MNYLPNRVSLDVRDRAAAGQPALQSCIEKSVFVEYGTRGDEIRRAIAEGRKIDLAGLPDKLQSSLREGFDKAQRTFALVQAIQAAEADIASRAPAYRPLHERVRAIQANIKAAEDRVRELRTAAGRTAGDEAGAARKKKLEAQIAALEAERKALQGTIPPAWDAQHTEFIKLLQTETKTRRDYRRNVDDAYEPVEQAVDTIKSTAKLASLRGDIEGLRAVIADRPPAEGAERAGHVMSAVNAVPGSRSVGAELSKVRRALRGHTPDKAEAEKALDAALQAFAAELAWRERATRDVLPTLEIYEAAIRDTIGLRQQPRLPEERLSEIAGCLAYHRDIALRF